MRNMIYSFKPKPVLMEILVRAVFSEKDEGRLSVLSQAVALIFLPYSVHGCQPYKRDWGQSGARWATGKPGWPSSHQAGGIYLKISLGSCSYPSRGCEAGTLGPTLYAG